VMLHGEGCVFPDHAKAVYAAVQGPKKIEWIDGSQIDFYDQETQVSRPVALATAHFRATLGAPLSPAESLL
jgi:uncharacterized protein